MLLSGFTYTEPDRQLPLYVELEASTRREEYALCYGRNWRIDINQDPEKISFFRNYSLKDNGALVMKNEKYLLLSNSFYTENFRRTTRCVDLTSGTVEEQPGGRVGVFLNWSLLVHMGSDRFQTLVSFPVEPEEKEQACQ